MYSIIFKPLLDKTVSIIFIILLSPIFLILTVSLFILNNGEPFFFQLRPGKNGKIFKIIKFKSMNDKRDDLGKLLPDNLRLTPFGKFVRKTSLDEIPQILNVIKGDMSIIGPRPLLPEYMPYYTAKERSRHKVKPGITGWAQINGRNNLDWDERLKHDIFYVDNLSFVLDFKILILTIYKVLKSDNVVVDSSSVLKDLNDERSNNL